MRHAPTGRFWQVMVQDRHLSGGMQCRSSPMLVAANLAPSLELNPGRQADIKNGVHATTIGHRGRRASTADATLGYQLHAFSPNPPRLLSSEVDLKHEAFPQRRGQSIQLYADFSDEKASARRLLATTPARGGFSTFGVVSGLDRRHHKNSSSIDRLGRGAVSKTRAD